LEVRSRCYKAKSKCNTHTSFSFGSTEFTSAADVGNYHAGYTGTYAGINYEAQWQGAGIVEILKNKTYGQLLNPMTYLGAPYGDNPVDYKYNTQGMTDAASKLGTMTPATYMDQKTKKEIQLIQMELRGNKF